MSNDTIIPVAAAEASSTAAIPQTQSHPHQDPSRDGTRDPISKMNYVPRDARLIAVILQSMGIEDVEPPALTMLLEFIHRYLFEVMQDALVYADHAGTSKSGTASSGVSTLTVDDIQLAIQSRINHSHTETPSKEMLLSLASTLNSVPLPPISDKYGIKLPPPQHCLTNVNFSIVPNPPPAEDDDEVIEDEREDTGSKQITVDDDEMADASTNLAETKTPIEQRGQKRTLNEDEDYD